MDQKTYPFTRDLVLVGGGHTHALVLNKWAMSPLPGVRVTLINPAPVAPYTGMLPGHVAGHYSRDELMIDLMRLARVAGARLILGKVSGLDLARRQIELPGRPAIPFDVASLDIGITSDLPQIEGYDNHAVSAKPLGGYAAAWEAYLDRVEKGRIAPRIAIIGGGVAGVELAMAMAHRLRDHHDRKITIIEGAARILPGVGPRARDRLTAHLRAASVDMREGQSVVKISADTVTLADGQTIASNLTLGAAGSRPQEWLQSTGLALHQGYVEVDAYLRSVTEKAVFAVGDCCHMVHAPRPKAGVFAVRQAPFLLANLRAALGAGVRRRYEPQRDYLKLISLGDRSAIADKWNIAIEGRWLWTLKDRIDAKFMGQFRKPLLSRPAYPSEMATGLREILAEHALCGGCGAKVGADPLRKGLSTIEQPARRDVAGGIGDDAAILMIGGQRQVIATDHLRALTEDLWMMARIAAVHALGDVWAMGATPQAALSSVTLPRCSAQMQARMLAEITNGAQSILVPAGAPIVGGHTALGAEVSIGFTVTGLVGAHPVAKRGVKAGDALVLTKALGTGVIMAAEMQALAPGDVVARALEAMVRPQGAAAAILASRAHAMTDVTGFGLAGHLLEMLDHSDLYAELYLDQVPILPGAEMLAARGISASVAPDNRAAAAHQMQFPDTPRADLLFDPQTAGGLLAAIPRDAIKAVVDQLRATGFEGAVLGQIKHRPTTGSALIDIRPERPGT